MGRRHVHYEAAFADFLTSRGIAYVPVDEVREPLLAEGTRKAFDFLVDYGQKEAWLVDIKGRLFPYDGVKGSARYWENWVTHGDLTGLREWQEVFGPGFEGRFVFAYCLQDSADRWPVARPHRFRNMWYAFLSVRLEDYQRLARTRSTRWQTVAMPRSAFRELAVPVGE